jgi:uroporphyrinogen-III synthase
MAKSTAGVKPSIKTILISQPKPDNDKNPYLQVASKHKLTLEFRQFIQIEPVSAKDFRKSKVDVNTATAIIFNSRNSIDHFFKIAEEIRYKPAAEMKYFCISEAIALYLQKYIQYRKRKVFFGNGTDKSLHDLLNKHKANENFLVACSNLSKDHEYLEKNKLKYQRAVVYKTVSANLKDIKITSYDMLIFFTPAGIKSLFENFPNFKQGKIKIAVFGEAAQTAAEAAGLRLDLVAPTPEAASMPKALELFLSKKL